MADFLQVSSRKVYKGAMTSRARRLICRLLIAVVAFAQASVAAYACARMPGTPVALQPAAITVPMASASADRSPPSGMHAGDGDVGSAAAALCVAHCQSGSQSADHASASLLPIALPSLSYTLFPPDPADARHRSRPPSATQGSPPGDPPHAILHCCLRD